MRFLSLKKSIFLTLFIFCVVTFFGYTAIVNKLHSRNVQANNRRAYSVLVGYNSSTNAEKLAKEFKGRITASNTSQKIFKMKLTNTAASISDKLSEINKNKNVTFSQPVYTYRTDKVSYPNDPAYKKQWGLKAVNALKAWKLSNNNKKVIVAVIDTGVSKNHPDLKGSVLSGYNFVDNTTNTNDDNGHGTHVAGIIAATINNKIGGDGIADDVKILPVKILNSDGMGDSFTIADGIFWAADHGAKVISMSLGASQYDQVLDKAIEYAHSKGIVLVAAAGNKSAPVEASPLKVYPASLANVIGVGAVNNGLTKAYFSYIGDYVDIAAPGEDIYSTYLKKGYATLSGTSMATPFVSGLAAMIIAKYPKLTPADVERVIEETATDLGTSGRDDSYGHGLINAEKALSGIYLNSVSIKDSSAVSVNYGISAKASISINIYDNNNNLIKALLKNKLEAQETHTIKWDKLDNTGKYIPNGTYKFIITVTNSKGNVVDTVEKSVTVAN